jgi:hypothetical protein
MERKKIIYARLAWGLWTVTIFLALVALALAIYGRSAPFEGWGFRGFPIVFIIPYSAMGILVLARHPGHAVGWIMLAESFFSALQGLLFEYMLFGLVLFPGRLPGAETVAWILNSYWVWMLMLLVLLLVVFPDGRLPSPRWRYFIYASFVGAIAAVTGISLSPGPLTSSFAALDNPYALEGLAFPLTQVAYIYVFGFFFLAFGISVAGLVSRMRRSEGQQRQQFKWFGYAAVLLLLLTPISGLDIKFLEFIHMVAILFLPVAIAIAILRHNLYDIDLLIRRTLVYSLVSAILVLVYFGTVVLAQNVISRFTGQAGQSPLAVVVSTLVIAALFTPLRRRIQDFIDRRFYRSKYDTDQILQAFSGAVRDEVDLDELQDHLVSVVDETMQPEKVSLWLQEEEGPTSEGSTPR